MYMDLPPNYNGQLHKTWLVEITAHKLNQHYAFLFLDLDVWLDEGLCRIESGTRLFPVKVSGRDGSVRPLLYYITPHYFICKI